VEGLVSKVTTLIGEDANKSVRVIAADEINRLIDAAGDAETLKAVGDLVDYAEKNAGDIANLISTTNGHTTKIAGLESNVTNLTNSVSSNTTEIGTLKNKIGTVEEGKTLIGLINETATNAATDAKNKADQALIDAKAHTDTEIGKVNATSSAIAGKVTAIENKLVGINVKVTDNIATAKQEAIEAAAADATTKANKALDDAKADATTKANKALSDAKEHTNTEVGKVAVNLTALTDKAITGVIADNKLTMSLG
jgi:hypothetical protein